MTPHINEITTPFSISKRRMTTTNQIVESNIAIQKTLRHHGG
jgi:hypothetical protein